MSALSKEGTIADKNPLHGPVTWALLFAMVGGLGMVATGAWNLSGKLAALETGQAGIHRDLDAIGGRTTDIWQRLTDMDRRLVVLEARSKETGK